MHEFSLRSAYFLLRKVCPALVTRCSPRCARASGRDEADAVVHCCGADKRISSSLLYLLGCCSAACLLHGAC